MTLIKTLTVQRLQLDSDLTLAKNKQMVRQGEAVHEQQQTLHARSATKGTLGRRGACRKHHQGSEGQSHWREKQAQRQQGHTNSGLLIKVTPLGKMSCSRSREAICQKCKRKGHYGTQCLSKTVAEVTEVSSYMEENFLDTVASEQENTWQTTINLYYCQNLEWGSRNVVQDLAHRKHPTQCLETARKRVTSEPPIRLREQFSACMECN